MIAAARQVIVFDLDDTLYLERDYVASGFAAVGDWFAGEYGRVGFGDAAWRHFEAGRRGDIFDAVLAEFGLPADPGLVARIIVVYRDHAPAIALQPDAHAWLSGPRDCGVALLTDGHEVAQRRKIAALGLEALGIWPIIVTDSFGRPYWKPHPRGFRAIEAAYGLPGSSFTYVADNVAKDFVAPRQLGWRTVQLVRPGGLHFARPATPAHAADRVIASLDELQDTASPMAVQCA